MVGLKLFVEVCSQVKLKNLLEELQESNREFSELLGLDYEIAEVLYSAYVMDSEKYGQLLNVDSLKVPLFDMFCFDIQLYIHLM